jgi:hypothetical protein
MMKKQLNIKETIEALNRNNVAPHLIVYEVALIRLIRSKRCVAFKKIARLADHSAPSFWCCSHEHASWNEAVDCTDTPFSGSGEFLEGWDEAVESS